VPGSRATRQSRSLTNGALRRLLVSHLTAVVAEWAAAVGVLVYAYERGGSTATGIASLCVLIPSMIGAPLTAALVNAHRPAMVRRLGLATQLVAYAASAAAMWFELPVAFAVVPAVAALIALATLRPTGAILLPALARSTRELTRANLGVSYCDNASALLGPLTAAVLLWAGGPTSVLVACAALTAIALLCVLAGSGVGPPAPPPAPGARAPRHRSTVPDPAGGGPSITSGRGRGACRFSPRSGSGAC
jgi:hypothetical protein